MAVNMSQLIYYCHYDRDDDDKFDNDHDDRGLVSFELGTCGHHKIY